MDDHQLRVLHAVPTLCLTGLIWFVQIAHYPMYSSIDAAGLPAYEQRYTQRVGWVVGPLMLAEVALALLLWVRIEEQRALATIGLGLLAAIWLSTAVLQVPCHRALAERADPAAMRRLVATNWIRTAAWSSRAGVAVAVLLRW